ncbi:hypothetical protein [Borrelia turicatae]|nr:hypothetical protein [Borrelia turicatae]
MRIKLERGDKSGWDDIEINPFIVGHGYSNESVIFIMLIIRS